MEIIYDKKGNAIEAILSKEEQLELLRENNKRAKDYKLTQLNQDTNPYGDKKNTTTS